MWKLQGYTLCDRASQEKNLCPKQHDGTAHQKSIKKMVIAIRKQKNTNKQF